MSQWYYKLGDEERGPVSFGDLVEMVRAGTLSEKVPVRRAENSAWASAWTVPTLFTIANRAAAPAEEAAPQRDADENTADAASTTAEMSGAARPVRRVAAVGAPRQLQRLRWVIAAAVGAMATLFFYRWWQWRSLRFPVPPRPGESASPCTFPLLGTCSSLECALLYFDFWLAVGALAWVGFGWAQRRYGGGE